MRVFKEMTLLIALLPLTAPVVGLAVVSFFGSLDTLLAYVFGGWVIVVIVSIILAKSIALFIQMKENGTLPCSAKN